MVYHLDIYHCDALSPYNSPLRHNNEVVPFPWVDNGNKSKPMGLKKLDCVQQQLRTSNTEAVTLDYFRLPCHECTNFKQVNWKLYFRMQTKYCVKHPRLQNLWHQGVYNNILILYMPSSMFRKIRAIKLWYATNFVLQFTIILTWLI